MFVISYENNTSTEAINVTLNADTNAEVTITNGTNDTNVKNVENVIRIGNSDGIGYFSFWLFFVEEYFELYPIEQIKLKNPEYLYMCLNRKRHSHRVELVERLKEE